MTKFQSCLFLCLALIFLLTGCGSDPEPTLTLTLPADTPPETIKLIQTTAPALEKNLPGLLRYQDSMTFQGVAPHSAYASASGSGLPEETTVTWLEFVVADDDGTIPKDYNAQGQYIRIGIVESGEALILQKDQVKSVFLDRLVTTSGDDLVLPLR